MNNRLHYSLLLLVFVLTGCDKEMVGYGKYALAFNNQQNADTNVSIFLDGEPKGTFLAKPGMASQIVDDKDLDKSERLVNVFVLNQIPKGEHQVAIAMENEVPISIGKIFIQDDAKIIQTYSF